MSRFVCQPLLAWLAVLALAIATHKLGWDFISLPLTFCVVGAGFVVTQVESYSARRKGEPTMADLSVGRTERSISRTDREKLDSRPDVPMGTRLREIAHSLDVDQGPVLVKDNRLRDLLRALAEEAD